MGIPVREEALFWSLVVLDGEKSNFKKSTSPTHQARLGTAGLDRRPTTGCQCDERSFIGQGALKPFAVPVATVGNLGTGYSPVQYAEWQTARVAGCLLRRISAVGTLGRRGRPGDSVRCTQVPALPGVPSGPIAGGLGALGWQVGRLAGW